MSKYEEKRKKKTEDHTHTRHRAKTMVGCLAKRPREEKEGGHATTVSFIVSTVYNHIHCVFPFYDRFVSEVNE